MFKKKKKKLNGNLDYIQENYCPGSFIDETQLGSFCRAT